MTDKLKAAKADWEAIQDAIRNAVCESEPTNRRIQHWANIHAPALIALAEKQQAEIDRLNNVAHQAAGHLGCALLYATGYPNDSHPKNANGFLVELRKELGMGGQHRTQSQFPIASPLPPYPKKEQTP